MARPTEYAKRITTALRFEPELHEVIKETADDLGVSFNWLVTRLVTEGLERMGDKFTLICTPRVTEATAPSRVPSEETT